jgi:hypothetical protein
VETETRRHDTDELRHQLTDATARASRAIEESVRKDAALETLSDVLQQGTRLRRLVDRLMATKPKAADARAQAPTPTPTAATRRS